MDNSELKKQVYNTSQAFLADLNSLCEDYLHEFLLERGHNCCDPEDLEELGETIYKKHGTLLESAVYNIGKDAPTMATAALKVDGLNCMLKVCVLEDLFKSTEVLFAKEDS